MSEQCPDCGNNKWKTIKKGLAWFCRKCGLIRSVAKDEQLPNDDPKPSSL